MDQQSNLVIIFGATHIGMRLANRLSQGFKVIVIDRPVSAPETPDGWQYRSSDFTPPPELSDARLVYVVTDEDKLNIRIALVVRNACAEVPIVITLVQSRIGKKLTRQLNHFSYICPAELAAKKFVDALYAPRAEAAANNYQQAIDVEKEVTAPFRFDPLVLKAVSAIVVLAFLSTIYFRFSEQLSWIDSIYFVTTMMATVGFGDISLKSSTTLSKIIGILLMIASVTNTAIVFALITDSLLKHRIALSFGRRKIKQSDHVLVIGIGSVGLEVVEELLKRGENVVAVDEQSNFRNLREIYAKRVPIVIGDSRLERTLLDVGLPKAKAIISVTNNDLTNLEIGLNAKMLNPNVRAVLRIYDQQLAQSLRDRLDIDFAFSMSSVASVVLAQYADAQQQDSNLTVKK